MEQVGQFLGIIVALLVGVACAIGMMAVWIHTNRPLSITTRTLMQQAEDTITFLFDDEALVGVTPRGRALLEPRDQRKSDWENFLALLSARFPHLRSQCRDLATVGRKTIAPIDGQHGWIEAEYWNGLARLTLVQDEDHPDDTIDPLTAAAMEHELETLRSIGEDSPQLIWKRDAEGVLVWANRAYIELSEDLFPVEDGGVLPWPPRTIFKDVMSPSGVAPVIDMHRIDVPNQEKPVWYEVTSLKRGTDTIHFAVDASAVVFSRDAQRTFVQTLTKTFAQLSVGLAIFDADRRLVLFNPALTDLTTLPPEFLIGRPTLYSVLDRLRDLKMAPEPKNYTTWRDQTVAVESAAVEGNYHEIWSLPNGQTLRVTGKPHPNGAVAFLMEDISDEISLTRKFRSQIDTSNAIIDNLTTAVVVFSSAGSQIMANRAYRDLWGSQPDDTLGNRDLADEMETWVTASAPSPVWMKLKDTLTHARQQTAWNGSIWLDSHVELLCDYAPLPDGNHQVAFTPTNRNVSDTGQIKSLEFGSKQSAHG